MGRRRTPGLRKRGSIWHIQKRIRGFGELCESTGESTLEEAERYLERRLEEIRNPLPVLVESVTWRKASTHYLITESKRSLERDAVSLEKLDPFIGDLDLDNIHDGTLAAFVDHERSRGISSSTVTRDLAVVRRIMKLSSRVWRSTKTGKPWLMMAPPLLTMPDWEDAKQPYPLSWDEQQRLFKELPAYLARMALYKVNTGLREQGICWLRWDWEVKVTELDASVFLVPGRKSVYAEGVWPGEKNREDSVVVHNRVARSVIEGQRGKHDVWVFPFNGHRMDRMNSNGWRKAWGDAKLPTEGVKKGPHNLKHTFGRRLRAAGVGLETRKVLLHHTNGDITTHYSAAELSELIDAVELISDNRSGKTRAMTLIRSTSYNSGIA